VTVYHVMGCGQRIVRLSSSDFDPLPPMPAR
jgi:hypothetical protein